MLELADEDKWLVKVRGTVVGSVKEELVEEVSSPFDAVLDLVGEVSESAHWDGFFRRVL